MKVKITTIIFLSISLFACNNEKRISVEDAEFDKYFFNIENIPVVEGKVLNLTPDEVKDIKISYAIVTPFEPRLSQIQKNGSLNSDGTFELEIDYAFPYQQIWLTIGDLFYAGIYANSDLFIELNADSLRKQRAYMNGPGVSYSGSDGELNTIMNNKVLYKPEVWRKINREIGDLMRNSNVKYDEFKIQYDSLYDILYKIDNEYIQENPSEYAWLLENDRLSGYYSQLCQRHWMLRLEMHETLLEEIKNHKAYLVSNNGSEFYNNLFYYLDMQSRKLNRVEYKDLKDYSKLSKDERESLNEYLCINEQRKAKLPYDTTKLKELKRRVFPSIQDTIITALTSRTNSFIDSVFSASKADFLKIKFSSKDPIEQKLMNEAVLASVHTKWCTNIIQERYDKNLQKIASIEKTLNDSKPIISDIKIGKPIAETPFGAKLYKVDTMDYKALLANLKYASKDKAIVIDFWATWCGPCLREMPHSKKLHSEAKELPVEFIYLCTSSGSDMEKWKTKIAEYELGGTHIFVEQKIENELMNLFSASGFPSYVFIDKNGEYRPGAISRMSQLDINKLTELIN